MSETKDSIIIFDTDCVLCSAWVGFILEHERDQAFLFVSAWSETGATLANVHGMKPADLNETYLVIEGGRGLTHSDAGLAIVRHLHMPWRALGVLRILPKPLRDAVYRLVARNRYRWFGYRAQCFVPPSGQSHRFIEGSRSTAAPGHRQAVGGTE